MSGQQSQNGSPGGSAAPTAARGDSGLTAGTDALRLACLECLEVSSEEALCCCASPSTCTGGVCSSALAQRRVAFANARSLFACAALQAVAVYLFFYDAACYREGQMRCGIPKNRRNRSGNAALSPRSTPPRPEPRFTACSFLAGDQAVLRAPFSTEHGIKRSSSSQAGWFEVRNGLKDAVRGGMLAQLVQELLLCCQQGGVPAAAAATAATTTAVAETKGKGALDNGGTDATTTAAAAGRGRRAMMWGGAEEARAAAGCLDALCSFAPGTTVWRRLLPGTFSGLFRAIRGIEVGSGLSGDGSGAGGIGSALTLGGGPGGSESQTTSRATGGARDGRRGGGGSKSALAEACLAVLSKVLLMCAGGGGARVAFGAAASRQSVGVGDGSGGGGDGSGGEGGVGVGRRAETSGANGADNPLVALQQLAVSSNASSRTADTQDQAATASTASSTGRGQGEASLPKTTTSGASAASAAAAAAAAAAVIAVEDPEWEARTSDRLRLLLPPLLAFCCLHPGWRVRCATANLAADLLRASCGGGDGGGSGAEAKSESGEESGLLKPLTALLVEALVGLLLDDMPQVGAGGSRGCLSFINPSHFRSLVLLYFVLVKCEPSS